MARRSAGTGARMPTASPPGARPAGPCRSGPAPARRPWRPSAARATTADAGFRRAGCGPAPGQTSLRRHGRIPADLLDAVADWQVQFDTDFHYETELDRRGPRRRMGATRRRTRNRAPPDVTPDHPPPRRSLACRSIKAPAIVQAVTTLTH